MGIAQDVVYALTTDGSIALGVACVAGLQTVFVGADAAVGGLVYAIKDDLDLAGLGEYHPTFVSEGLLG